MNCAAGERHLSVNRFSHAWTDRANFLDYFAFDCRESKGPLSEGGCRKAVV